MAIWKINPFTPGKRLTRPEMFAGRTSQLDQAAHLLAQAGEGNVRHGLLTGDRGIGKSSLASQIAGIAQRDPKTLDLIDLRPPDFPYELVVAEHVSQTGQSLADVVAGLLHDLNRALGRSNKRLNFDLEFDFKIVKARLVESRSQPADVTVAFVDAMEQAWDSIKTRVNGIVLIIDEVDRIAEQPGVSTFFKVATEMFASRQLENIMLLPVGMVGVQELLKTEHESVGRVFEVIHLPLLTKDESKSIVDRALEPTGVRIEWQVNERIAELSGGFPNPVHLIASEAFEADDDDLIDSADLELGIESVVTEKWKEQFDADYVKAGSGKTRNIIKAMASYDQLDVPSSWICQELGVKQPEISSNIADLMKRDVIVRPDRGVYRFKDPLFRQYVVFLDVLGSEPVERRPRKRTT